MPNTVIAKPFPRPFIFVRIGKTPLTGCQALSDCEFDSGFMLHLCEVDVPRALKLCLALAAEVHLNGLRNSKWH